MRWFGQYLCSILYGVFCCAQVHAQPGLNPFQISQFSKDGGTGWNQDAVYNNRNNEYLVVWSNSEKSPALPFIYAQRIDADTGAFRGQPITVSSESFIWAFEPSVAYNSLRNEYLVTFSGIEPGGYPKRYGKEIYAQRINADNGEKLGGFLRVSDVGFEDRPEEPGADLQATDPCVVFNEKTNQYLVVWWGDEVYNKGTKEAPEYYFEWEIFGQFLSGDTAGDIGANDFRISVHGDPGAQPFVAVLPAVILNTADNQYLVTWSFNDYSDVPDGDGIFGRRIDAVSHQFLDSQFRIDTTGQIYPPLSATFLAYNPINHHYFVTWTQYDAGPDRQLDRRGYEIFSQRLDASTGAKVGERVRLSSTGILGQIKNSSHFGAAAYNPFRHQYIVVWDSANWDPDNRLRIYGQAVDANTGLPVRSVDYRMSDVPSLTALPGLPVFIEPFVKTNTQREGFLAGWLGWNLTHDGIGVWGQLYNAASVDAMNTQPTPTPAPTSTPAPNPTGQQNGDIRASLVKVKGKQTDYSSFCGYSGPGQVSYVLSVYRSADNKLDTVKDKKIITRSGVLSAGMVESVVFAAKAKKKPSFLIAACQSTSPLSDSAPKNNIKLKKLALPQKK